MALKCPRDVANPRLTVRNIVHLTVSVVPGNNCCRTALINIIIIKRCFRAVYSICLSSDHKGISVINIFFRYLCSSRFSVSFFHLPHLTFQIPFTPMSTLCCSGILFLIVIILQLFTLAMCILKDNPVGQSCHGRVQKHFL